MKKNFFLISISILFFSMSSDIQKKSIRDKDYDIECYVSLKKVKSYDRDKIYYWFKSGEIHNSVSSSGGLVLHDLYLKYYKSNQIAESGKFDYGVRHGEWKTWNKKGRLLSIINWKHGYKNGDYISFDSIGKTIYKGTYKNNKKIGTWINYKTKDTLIYKGGTIFVENPETTKKPSFFKRLLKPFKKKDNKNAIKSERNSKKELKKQSKESFFKRLFKRKKQKDPKNSTDSISKKG